MQCSKKWYVPHFPPLKGIGGGGGVTVICNIQFRWTIYVGSTAQ